MRFDIIRIYFLMLFLNLMSILDRHGPIFEYDMSDKVSFIALTSCL